MSSVEALLDKLNIGAVNAGACGNGNWINDRDGAALTSHNPFNNEAIASVQQATQASYDVVVRQAQMAFMDWRMRPAPKRGDFIRDLGNALREHKEALGDLVSLEMGKIRAEGHGEVQEMIDICDFAVGLSRQLYGLTMHSERAGHRMYEQWHPLGPIGVITAFNFPVAVWSWNAAIAAVCGDTVIWKPSLLTPLVRHRRATHRQSRRCRPRCARRRSTSSPAATSSRRADDQRPAPAADFVHRLDSGGPARRCRWSRSDWVGVSLSLAATTPSSCMRTPTSTS